MGFAIANLSLERTNHPSPSVIPKSWKKLWHIKAMPRVRLSAWRACTNALPTRANLFKRGGIEDPICGLCGEAPETTDHLLLHCSRTSPVWYGCMARIQNTHLRNLSFKEFMWSCMDNHPPEYISLIIYLAWEIWQHRNKELFEGRRLDFTDVINRGQRRWGEMQYLESTNKKTRCIAVNQSWKTPNHGKTKLNSDIAVWKDGRVGLGFVLRDHRGEILLAGKKEIQAEGTTTVLEGMAVLYALQMTHQFQMTADEVECDNQTFVKYMEGVIRPEVYCDVLVEDVREMMDKVSCQQVSFVPRNANYVAYELAHGPVFISIRHTPEHIRRALERDVSER